MQVLTLKQRPEQKREPKNQEPELKQQSRSWSSRAEAGEEKQKLEQAELKLEQQSRSWGSRAEAGEVEMELEQQS